MIKWHAITAHSHIENTNSRLKELPSSIHQLYALLSVLPILKSY